MQDNSRYSAEALEISRGTFLIRVGEQSTKLPDYPQKRQPTKEECEKILDCVFKPLD